MPNLTTVAGHVFVYHCCLQEICRSLSLDFLGLYAARAQIEELPQGWTAFFRPQKWKLVDFIRAFSKVGEGRPRVFFLESFTTRDLCSAALAVFLFARREDCFWLFFRYDLASLPKKGKVHLFLSKLLRMKLRGRFVAMTDSELIRDSFAPYLNLHLMPIPHAEGFLVKEKRGERIILWWPGPPRESKGLKEIQRLCAFHTDKDVELVLASSAPVPRGNALKVRPIADVLPREEYIIQMAEADIILLPYDPLVYRCGTSGILIEAVVAGKIPVVKDGSWLSHELRRFSLDELIIDWDKAGVLERILELVKNSIVREKLERMRENYQNTHSLQAYQQEMTLLLNNLQTD